MFGTSNMMPLGILCQKNPDPAIFYNFNTGDFTNTGTLAGVGITQSVSGGTSSFAAGRLYNKWRIWRLDNAQTLAQASQPFEFGADIEIIVDSQFPFLSKTNAFNGGSSGWEIGFLADQTPYYKNLVTNVVTAATLAAPLNTTFAFKVVSDGTNHVFYIDGVNAGSVTSSTSANVGVNDLLHINNSYFVGEFYLDNFYVK